MGLIESLREVGSPRLQLKATHHNKGDRDKESEKREIYDKCRPIEQNEEVFQRMRWFWDDPEYCD